MKKKLCKSIAILLVIVFLLPSWTFAIGYEEFTLIDEEYLPVLPMSEEISTADIFTVRPIPDIPYKGYIFRLVEDVIVSLFDKM